MVCRARLLVLHQRRKNGDEQWVFAKGGLERGESAREAALRELREEAGIIVPTCRFLRLHRYQQRSRRRTSTKVVYWFVATLDTELEPVPQRAEGFTDARWVELAEAQRLLTHPSDRELAELALRYAARQ